MPHPTRFSCHGIAYGGFQAGDGLLVVTCPTMALETITSLIFDETEAHDRLMEVLIPLLDAFHANVRYGMFQGKATEDSRMADTETLPWTWEGRVLVARPDAPVIDAEAELSPITAARIRQPVTPEAIAFERAHPWLNRVFTEAATADTLVRSLTDQGLEGLIAQSDEQALMVLLEAAEPAQQEAFHQAMRRNDAPASMQAMVEIMRAHLTKPRFPPLALVLPDTTKNRASLRRLLDDLLVGFLSDIAQRTDPC